MYKTALALLVGLMLSITLQSASAFSLSCKRTSGMHDGFATKSVFESWFPKRINPTADDKIPSSRDTQVSFQINGAKYTLTPSKVMTGSLPERAGYKSVTGVRYKCNASSHDVKIAFGKTNENFGGSTQLAALPSAVKEWGDIQLCAVATKYSANNRKLEWQKSVKYSNYLREAKRRGLNCSVGESSATHVDSTNSIAPISITNERIRFSTPNWTDKAICQFAWFNSNWEIRKEYLPHVREAKRRGLNCGIGEIASTQVASTDVFSLPNCPSSQDAYWHNCFGTYTWADGDQYVGGYKDDKKHGQGTYTWADGEKYVGEFKDGKEHGQGTYTWTDGDKYVGGYKDGKRNGTGTYTFANGEKYVGGYKDGKRHGQGTFTYADARAAKEGVWKDGEFQYAKKLTPSTTNTDLASSTNTQTNKSISAELIAAQRKAEELEQRLAVLEAQQQQQQQTISQDSQIPLITITQLGTNQRKGTIRGFARDNVEIAEVLVDGVAVNVDSDGSFEWSGFVPATGKDIIIEAVDTAALSASEVIRLERGQIQQASGPRFDDLDPTVGRGVVRNKNALALIVGISDYERTDAPAIYADKDAQYFHDYASFKLGISDSNITTMINDKAELGDVILAVKDWMRRSSKPGKSDVYVFFAGHGLASQDGEKMYLLPFDGRPRLLDDTALARERLFSDIALANPRSVTVFLDTCYSGTTRGTDMLIASRPVILVSKKQPVPDNFTVMTAAAGDQTAKPLEAVKHGMFSYFLMKGMEGDADADQDNKITAGELHSYVQTNVIQQSSGRQTPELQGDADRVLVQFQ